MVATESFERDLSFKAPKKMLYNILTDPGLIKTWAGGHAEVDVREGGKYSLYNGEVTGVFEKLDPGNEVQAKFRWWHFPEGKFGHITFSFEERDDNTAVTVMATDIPEQQFEIVRNGFDMYSHMCVNRILGANA
ncbi:activator of heat shock protein 90 ATPase-like protein 1 [Aphelenchoides avenae]|nr:activator of heat shock protein 90 ATPase-like protein 1 [Aphelenchus avenae]